MSSEAGIAETVTALVEAVNEGRTGEALEAFAADATIVEDIAPFAWHGPAAARDWLAAMARNAALLGVSDVAMRLGEPRRIEVEGERGYAIFPGRLALTAGDGELGAEGLLTFTFRSEGGRWLLNSLTWSGERPEAGR